MNRCKHCGRFMTEKYAGYHDKHGKFHRTECYRDYDNKDICFECNFWLEHFDNDNNPEDKFLVPFRYKHKHYIADINTEHKKDYFKGFGGAKTRITFNDGKVIECDNVWFQGDIPKRFWKLMPDNATLEWLR